MVIPSNPSLPSSMAAQLAYVEEKFASLKVEVMHEMVRDSFDRCQRGSSEDLEGGVFMPNDYFRLLNLHPLNTKTRIDWLMKRQAFYIGYAPIKNFEMVPTTSQISGVIPYHFAMKKGSVPSVALQALLSGPSLIGCGEAQAVVQAKALEKLVGVSAFNSLFFDSSETPFVIHSFISNYTHPLIDLAAVRDIRKGDYVAFTNVPIELYGRKHPWGESQAYNTICCGITDSKEPLFTGLGLPPNGLTQKEIGKRLLEDFNVRPLEGTMIPESVRRAAADIEAIAKQLSQYQLSKTEFEDLGGGGIVTCTRENMEGVVRFMQNQGLLP